MIPKELRDLPQWAVCGPDKVPRNPRTGEYASVTDPATWGTYEEALASPYPYKGFMLRREDPYTFIDLDKPETPEQAELHKRIFDSVQSYAESSLSGEGIHIACRGKVPRGVRRDKVELYSEARFMICTGNTVRDVPIVDCQALLDNMFKQMSQNGNGNGKHHDHPEYEETISDRELVDVAMHAANGEKFTQLCNGHWQGDYPSQSEADYALMNILAFYSRSNEQCKRLFRYSGLGQRDKALRDDYLDAMLRKVRSEQPPYIDFSSFTLPPTSTHETVSANDVVRTEGAGDVHRADHNGGPVVAVAGGGAQPPASPRVGSDLKFPPGFVGELAQYIYDSSIRPVPEIATAAALALCAGVAGRQYNISRSGLNLYLILLAKTGVGKEGGTSGIERIISATRQKVPMVDQFIGPAAFASGQSLIRYLDEHPCFVSVLGEFGLTLQTLTDPNANSNAIMMRRVMLDLYSKSGEGNTLRATVYSDKANNTQILASPAPTLYGESTPETFYSGLDASHIADGLIPRFLIIEYGGNRPRKNPNAFFAPPEPLIQRFADLVTTVLQMQANQSWVCVELSDGARRRLDAFEEECDAHLAQVDSEAIRQLWNRAVLKAIRVSALLAAVDRPHGPTVQEYEAEWAIELVRRDTEGLMKRFQMGDVGEGVAKQNHDLERIVGEYLATPTQMIVQKDYGVTPEMHKARVVPRVYLQRRTANLSAFKKYRAGARAALDEAIKDLVDGGVLVEVNKQQSQEKFGTSQRLFLIRM